MTFHAGEFMAHVGLRLTRGVASAAAAANCIFLPSLKPKDLARIPTGIHMLPAGAVTGLAALGRRRLILQELSMG
jgi:hypothetical protein